MDTVGPIGSLPGQSLLSGIFRGLTSFALNWAGPVFVKGAAFAGFTYLASDFALEPLIAELQSLLSGAPLVFLDVLGYVGIDKAISFILSAYIVRASSRLIFKGSD